ncbi:hypothetical protein AcV7_001608 [Taiwanofungus camphoratus]|nr:hypothetical protein AcV7_001608 [Antrodia cinnamomea]KAI0944942.1 hypothetical protein AcV7_001608 [Antrodia cinnamomea]
MRVQPTHTYATLAVFTLGLSALPSALAWGAAGHEIVATIAQMHLHPAVLPVLCDILDPPSAQFPRSSSSADYPPCHLAPIAAWADRVRRSPAYRYTAPLHYVGALDDLPSEACEFPGARGWAGKRDGNVLAAVRNSTTTLADFLDGEAGAREGEEALKFLVHFIGDMHMPLHLTGRERGGNGARVTFDGRVTNLHSVWDNLLIAQALRTVPANYTRPLAGPGAPAVEAHLRGAIYDPYVRRIMHEGFGIGANGAGRFGPKAHDEWLECPAEDADEESATISWVLEKVQTLLGYELFGIRLGESERKHRATELRPAKRNSGRGLGWLGSHTSSDEDRWDDSVLCPYAWAYPIHELNCAPPIWPAALDKASPASADLHHGCASHDHSHDHDHDEDEYEASANGGPRPHPDLLELDTPAYAGHIRAEWVVERLLATAGVRLAGILNRVVLGTASAPDVRAREGADAALRRRDGGATSPWGIWPPPDLRGASDEGQA